MGKMLARAIIVLAAIVVCGCTGGAPVTTPPLEKLPTSPPHIDSAPPWCWNATDPCFRSSQNGSITAYTGHIDGDQGKDLNRVEAGVLYIDTDDDRRHEAVLIYEGFDARDNVVLWNGELRILFASRDCESCAFQPAGSHYQSFQTSDFQEILGVRAVVVTLDDAISSRAGHPFPEDGREYMVMTRVGSIEAAKEWNTNVFFRAWNGPVSLQ